jgi:beta-mannanase
MLMNSVKSINYSNPIKTNSHNSAELKEHNSASSIDNKIAKCYREVDECRNYA